MLSSSDSQFPFDITMEAAYVDDSEGVSQMVTKIDIYPKNSNPKQDQAQSKSNKKSHKRRKSSKKIKTDENNTVLPFISQYLTEKPKETKNTHSKKAHTLNDNQNIVKKEPTPQPADNHHKQHISKVEEDFSSSDTIKQEELLDRLDCIIQKIRTKSRQRRFSTKQPNINPTQKSQTAYPKNTISQQTQANLSNTDSYPATSQSEFSQDDYYSYYSLEPESDGSFQDLRRPTKRPNHRNHHNPKKKQIRRTHKKRRRPDTQNKDELLNKNPNTLSPKPQQSEKQCQTIIGGDSLDIKDKNMNLFTESYTYENDGKETYEELEENEDETLGSKENEEEGDDELDEIEEEEEDNDEIKSNEIYSTEKTSNFEEESKNDQNYDQTNSLNDQNYDQANSLNDQNYDQTNSQNDQNYDQTNSQNDQNYDQNNSLNDQNYDQTNSPNDQNYDQTNSLNDSQNIEEEEEEQSKTDGIENENQILRDKNQELIDKNKELLEENQVLKDENQKLEDENREFEKEKGNLESSELTENQSQNDTEQTKSDTDNQENSENNQSNKLEEEEEREDSSQQPNSKNDNEQQKSSNFEEEEEENDEVNDDQNKAGQSNDDIITTPNRRPASSQPQTNYPSPPRNSQYQRYPPGQMQQPNRPNYYYNDPNRTYGNNDPYYNRNYGNPNMNYGYDPNMNNSYDFKPNNYNRRYPPNNQPYNPNNRYNQPQNPNNGYNQTYNPNNGYNQPYSPNNRYNQPHNPNNGCNRYPPYDNSNFDDSYRNNNDPNYSYNGLPQRYNNGLGGYPDNRQNQSQNVSSFSPQKSFSLSRQTQIVFSTANRNNKKHLNQKLPPKTPPNLPPSMPSDAESHIVSNITMQDIEMTNKSIMDSSSSVLSEAGKGTKSEMILDKNKPLISTLQPKKNYTFEPSSIIYGDDGVWMFLPLKEEEEEEDKNEVSNKTQESIKEDKNNDSFKNNISESNNISNINKTDEVQKKPKKKKKKSSIALTSNFSKIISILRSHDDKMPKNLAMNISRILTPRKNEHFAFLLDSSENIVGIYSFGFNASSIEKVWGDDSLEKNLEVEQIMKTFNYNHTSKSFCNTETLQIDNSLIGFSI